MKITIVKLKNLKSDVDVNGLCKEVREQLDLEGVTIDSSLKKMSIESFRTIGPGKVKILNTILSNYSPSSKAIILVSDDGEVRLTKISMILSGLGIMVLIIAILCDKVFFKTNVALYSVLYIVSYLLVAYDVIFQAIKQIGQKKFFDETFLMSLATIGAIALSFFPGKNEFIEAVSLMIFYKIGEFFQDLAVRKSRKNIDSLLDLRPETANLKGDEQITLVHPKTLSIGDLIVVRVGETIPIDGIVRVGSGDVDTKHLTGESNPVKITPNKEVFSGSINLTSVLEIEVTSLFSDSVASKIVDFIENNSDKKAKSERFITKFSKIYTPTVVLIGLVLAFLVPLVISLFGGKIYSTLLLEYIPKALVFLVASCPCAFVLSVPLSFFAGIGRASKAGILIRSGNDLDDLRFVKHVAFDKTGTITRGNFEITKIISHNNLVSEEEILMLAAHAEAHSNHLIAKSIINAYDGVIDLSKLSNIDEISGQGIIVDINHQKVILGSKKLLSNNLIDFPAIDVTGTQVHLAVDSVYYGSLIISDEIKSTSREAILKLTKLGITSTMITGDLKVVAEEVAAKIGVTNTYYEKTPFEKVDIVSDLKLTGKTAFVGDGINDAPVLLVADIGIAMGGMGSDIAIEASDIILMNDDLCNVAVAFDISRKTNRIVKQNIAFALLIKIVVLSLAISGITESLFLAIFADVGVSLLAILNATRLLIFKNKN